MKKVVVWVVTALFLLLILKIVIHMLNSMVWSVANFFVIGMVLLGAYLISGIWMKESKGDE